jgi:hypothetical protein
MTTLQTIDLPDQLEPDRARLRPDRGPGPTIVRAVPYRHVEAHPNGTDVYQELDHFDPTEEYRTAVANRTLIDGMKIRFELPTTTEI